MYIKIISMRTEYGYLIKHLRFTFIYVYIRNMIFITEIVLKKK